MSAARRPLLTATAAGTLLCALWFVPSANATGEQHAQVGASSAGAEVHGGEPRLAETGGIDTTPYLLGGATFLAVGAGFVTLAMRQSGRAS
ncbi:LAETG motif-containing sortase-dependent surface protein [Streptomyces sp. NPDC006339]|uniref:LAETG motif-containing sortase-dependent surface protein n=1 Tax=Streptomyces sp. NPDC006339 TaxID=3156755 RepID=UPI00339E4928